MKKTLKILSYNLNGIRAAIKKDWINWVGSNNFDIIGIQETKAQEEQVSLDALKELGFKHLYWHSAEKKGYSGVTIFSKIEPDRVERGMGVERFDNEGRVIRADFGDLTLLNCYFPSGTSGDIRQSVKYDFLETFYAWINELRKERPNLIIQGDYNIAHTELDIHNPKSNKNTSGFLPEERAWMTKWFNEGDFIDTFRMKNPEQEKYSWWSYRAGARKNNKGWRIDYQSVSKNLKDKVVHSDLLNDAIHSDHCPCLLEISL
ncbi:MAG: exodeoxyribonuclease III [Saprospiraceae bacterium]|nr:exodeoxyribonuclease III [Saprospiraceae bacterium]